MSCSAAIFPSTSGSLRPPSIPVSMTMFITSIPPNFSRIVRLARYISLSFLKMPAIVLPTSMRATTGTPSTTSAMTPTYTQRRRRTAARPSL